MPRILSRLRYASTRLSYASTAALTCGLVVLASGCGEARERARQDAAGSAAAGGSAAAAEVRAAFEASRDALRSLDVEGFLAGYEDGPDLLVVDPTGEYVGRRAFERFARAWFREARQAAPTYGLVTARERVHPLDESTAVAVVHWSSPAASGSFRSLLLYRKGGGGWRIAAEHSAAVPPETGVDASPDSTSPGTAGPPGPPSSGGSSGR